MSDDIAKLEELHTQLRNARALLPQLVRKLAFASDEGGSMRLFEGVAHDLAEWQASTVELEANFNELKPLMAELNGKTV